MDQNLSRFVTLFFDIYLIFLLPIFAMAVRKLYGNLNSIDTLRALISIYEHELEDHVEFIHIDLKSGENQTAAFLSLSPFGEVPVLEDDDLTLFDSRAIMRYISHAYYKPGKDQVFEEPRLQGTVATWIDVEDHVFGPPTTKLMTELVDKPSKGLQTDEAVVAEEAAKLAKVLDSYEERLQKFDYLGGNKFTSADLTHIPKLHFLYSTPLKRLFLDRPCVYAWSHQLLSRPSSTKVFDMVRKFKASINEV